MAITETSETGTPSRRHRRNTSSVIRSIMTPRGHKRSPSAGAVLSRSRRSDDVDINGTNEYERLSIQHVDRGVLGEMTQNQERPQTSPKKSRDGKEKSPTKRGLHKRALSTISLKSLAKEKDKESKQKTREAKESQREVKKSKSQTSLVALLRPKASKPNIRNKEGKGKENQAPTTMAREAVTPIWAEYSSQPYQEISHTTTIPLRDGRDSTDSVQLVSDGYSPIKKSLENSENGPTARGRIRSRSKPRPQSAFIFPPPAMANAEGLGITFADADPFFTPTAQCARQAAMQDMGEYFIPERPSQSSARPVIPTRQYSADSPRESLHISKRGSRVMAAVAAFDGIAKEAMGEKAVEKPQNLDAEFEAVLESRNVPQNLRQRLRSLDTRIKADFVKQDKAETPRTPRYSPAKYPWNTEGNDRTSSQMDEAEVVVDEEDQSSPSKRSRPLSKTFNLGKGESVSPKKQKSDGPNTHRRSKSFDTTRSSSAKSISSIRTASGKSVVANSQPLALPEDFVDYLRTEQDPEKVEVGKMHKLRLLLRNETINWVDSFIQQGGMMEVIELLHRIMKIEWREEHEDTLLHEVLLCLKALCTAKLGLEELPSVQASLFPALLRMLFDEERKGPSEFATRGIIITLLFSYLENAPQAELADRAKTVLSYLRDPALPEENKPLGFIDSMYQPRPYRIWNKEITNVTKEVFWIFLHHLNVVPVPQGANAAEAHNYTQAHFPKERPPVPAAPYIGGVEWEATNYLANHLDLMNAVIASLPTVTERNQLRQDLKSSGFEKVMGGSLRTCKEKFYGAVHDGLKTWIAAALEDGWDVKDVRMGPPADERKFKSSPRKKADAPPKLDLPKLEAPKMDLPKLDIKLDRGLDDGWV
ncbi:hypothetical protein L228DRAFT_236108 [Xylona heveae TC161]|uniref:Formin GTPase-binding domain-containing protein n=1 Tax=Xylona heveae (strain CBS 132557 / TC161) TaxID=1328760 RepID=A0A165IIX4_XYLHT|nr:hypothetical protein L228DRAFT_236108 [Xylona heveae TC161]KZF24958.1 hypothetical protein L228DRAFT_236108 [Xylona heveae TC161]